jgi:integrase
MGHSTLNKMFERMGYGHITVHGLRTTASTLLNEQGFRPDIIERQLAHNTERNRIRAAYNRAEYLEERRHMLQHWANYLDAVASGAAVTALRGRAA